MYIVAGWWTEALKVFSMHCAAVLRHMWTRGYTRRASSATSCTPEVQQAQSLGISAEVSAGNNSRPHSKHLREDTTCTQDQDDAPSAASLRGGGASGKNFFCPRQVNKMFTILRAKDLARTYTVHSLQGQTADGEG